MTALSLPLACPAAPVTRRPQPPAGAVRVPGAAGTRRVRECRGAKAAPHPGGQDRPAGARRERRADAPAFACPDRCRRAEVRC